MSSQRALKSGVHISYFGGIVPHKCTYRVTCDEKGLSINILQFLSKEEVQKQKDIHVQFSKVQETVSIFKRIKKQAAQNSVF